jgi:hypothetical protein
MFLNDPRSAIARWLASKQAAAQQAPAFPYGFASSPAYMGQGSTGGATPTMGAPAKPWVNPDGGALAGSVGSPLNGSGTQRVFASPQDQAMLNANTPLTADRANQIYDAYQRVGGGTDVSNTWPVQLSQGTAPFAGLAQMFSGFGS